MAMMDIMRSPREDLAVAACGRTWRIRRSADLETLWQAMGEDDDAFAEDERLPYWCEIWPSSLALAEWLCEHGARIAGERCLDLGCGLGLSALVGASLGARVTGMDYEWPAVAFARVNAGLNTEASFPRPAPDFVMADWRAPAFRPGCFTRIWGGDVMYERRFAQPVADFLLHSLAPEGICWVAEPNRNVYTDFAEHVQDRGLSCEKRVTRRVAQPVGQGPLVTVNIWEISRL